MEKENPQINNKVSLTTNQFEHHLRELPFFVGAED
jgi:hypothetical protein